MSEQPIESDDFMVGEEVQILKTDYLGTILNIYTRHGVRYYDIHGRNLAGELWRDSFAKHQLRKKTMNQISLKQAYDRIREELGKNPDYFKAWVDTLAENIEIIHPRVITRDEVRSILADTFSVAFPEPSTKSLEEYHS